jgi:hypothetical protein
MNKTPQNLASLPASESARRQSLAQWESLLRRYPLASPWSLAFQILSTLGANGLIAWMVATERMTPFELVVLVAIEGVLLIFIAWLHSLAIPREALEKNPSSVAARLGTLAFALVWLSGAYGIVFFAFVPSSDEILHAAKDPLAFLLGSNLKWPLLITVGLAVVDAIKDHLHFHDHGGQFLSTPGLQGVARWLTLLLGGIPFFVPAVAVMMGVMFFVDRVKGWLKNRAKSADANAFLGMLLLPAIAIPFFGTMTWLMSSGVSGWAVGYCAAKFVSELFVVCLPLIATKAHAEESAAPVGGARATAKRKSRLP